MRVTFASIVCLVVALINLIGLTGGYWTIPDHYRLAANVALFVMGTYLLFRGAGKKRRADDIGAPALLSLRGQTERQAAELHALETKVRQLESDLGTARRRDAESQLRKVAASAGAEAQVVSLVSMLQNKGRFLDFLMDDITSYPDSEVGAAARVVHQGCREVLRDYFDIAEVAKDAEGTSVTLDKNFDAARYRLVGRVGGQPPFRGTVLHRGWLTTKVKLPRLTGSLEHRDTDVIAPAEIELN
jgi:hypothetical protein